MLHHSHDAASQSFIIEENPLSLISHTDVALLHTSFTHTDVTQADVSLLHTILPQGFINDWTSAESRGNCSYATTSAQRTNYVNTCTAIAAPDSRYPLGLMQVGVSGAGMGDAGKGGGIKAIIRDGSGRDGWVGGSGHWVVQG
jgi:hypothetical protein